MLKTALHVGALATPPGAAAERIEIWIVVAHRHIPQIVMFFFVLKYLTPN